MGLRPTWISALDRGTTKICCFLARSEKNIPKFFCSVSDGVNMDEVESSLSAAVSSAEKMARRRIDHVLVNILVNISCGPLHSSKIEMIEICVSLA